jgi:sulfate permease, SulP family
VKVSLHVCGAARSGRKPNIIILRVERVPYIDSTGASALEGFVRQAHGNGTQLILCDLREQPGEFLDKLWPKFAGAERVATFQIALEQVSRRP